MLAQLANPWWVLVLVGIAAGILSGALGVGSGILLVPALVILLSTPQKGAQGTSLAVIVPMALVGAIRYWRNPEVQIDLGVVAWLVLGALPGVLVGTELAARLPAVWLRRAFAVFMVIVAARMFFLSPKQQATPAEPSGQTQTQPTQENGERS